MDLEKRIHELRSEVEVFSCRPSSLVADVVLLALAADLVDTGQAVGECCRSALPHKAYANARLAFETAQNLLVLATHENYRFAGALAWVYFESKDAKWRAQIARTKAKNSFEPTEEGWLQRRVNEMAEISNSVLSGSGELLQQALAVVRRDRKKRPDNWLHENMSRRHHRSYELLAARKGNTLSSDTAELNESIYQALCRETHVRPRLDSFGIIHDRSTKTVRLDIMPRNLEGARSAVLNGTELAMSEGITAVRWQRNDAV